MRSSPKGPEDPAGKPALYDSISKVSLERPTAKRRCRSMPFCAIPKTQLQINLPRPQDGVPACEGELSYLYRCRSVRDRVPESRAWCPCGRTAVYCNARSRPSGALQV